MFDYFKQILFKAIHNIKISNKWMKEDTYASGAGTGGAIFGRSVNPIPIGEGRLSPPITTGTPNVFHLPASLMWHEIMDLISD